MAEGGMDGFKHEISKLQRSFRGLVIDTEKRLDKDFTEVQQTLSDLAPALGHLLSPDNLPKVIQATTAKTEYISIRRVEGSELEHRFIKKISLGKDDPFNTLFLASMPTSFIEEGQVVILDRPVSHDMKCKDPQVETRIENKIIDKIGEDGLKNYCNFNWLAMMAECPEEFKQEEWEPINMNVTLITKRNGKFYSAELIEDVNNRGSYGVHNFEKVKPTKDSRVEVLSQGYFQSNEDRDASQEFFRKWARLYVLTEGSSEKSGSRVEQKLTQLNPSTIPA